LELCLRQLEQFPPEVASENFVAIGENGDWQTMKLVHLEHVGLRHLESSERMCQWNEVGISRKLVDHH
jgi:hypothetical protein